VVVSTEWTLTTAWVTHDSIFRLGMHTCCSDSGYKYVEKVATYSTKIVLWLCLTTLRGRIELVTIIQWRRGEQFQLWPSILQYNVVYVCKKSWNLVEDAFICYKQKCKVASFNLAGHPVGQKLLKFNLVGSRQRSRQSYCNNKKAYFLLAHPAAVAVECGYGLDTAVIIES